MTRMAATASSADGEWAGGVNVAGELLAAPEIAFALSVAGIVATALWVAHPKHTAPAGGGLTLDARRTWTAGQTDQTVSGARTPQSALRLEADT